MAGGTMFVSRAKHLFPQIQAWLEAQGFSNVTVTEVSKDGLNFLINEVKPRLLIMSSRFYEAATPYMLGELHKTFPNLEITAISIQEYPASLAVYFIWHGVKSYVNLWEGEEEFKRGMQFVRDGKQYISPMVQSLIDDTNVWPNVDCKITKRHMECLIMLCCGFIPEHISKILYISRRTVNVHLNTLYGMFGVKNREEMVALAWQLDLVTKEDIQFYGRKTIDFSPPDWAKDKIDISRRIVRYGA